MLFVSFQQLCYLDTTGILKDGRRRSRVTHLEVHTVSSSTDKGGALDDLYVSDKLTSVDVLEIKEM